MLRIAPPAAAAARWCPSLARSCDGGRVRGPCDGGRLSAATPAVLTRPRAGRSRGAAAAPATRGPKGRSAAPDAGTALRAAAGAGAASELGADPVTVVLFKHDLRLSDHPGLAAALASWTQQDGAALESWLQQDGAMGHVLPLFVFDPAVISGLPLNMLAPLLAAVSALRDALRQAGSDLAVRVGPTEEHIASLASSKVSIGEIVLEEEVESMWQQVIHRIEDALARQGESSDAPQTLVTRWRAPLFQNSQVPSSATFPEFLALSGPPLDPLPPPSALPGFPASLDPGCLPSLEELLSLRGPSALAPSNPGTSDNGAGAMADGTDLMSQSPAEGTDLLMSQAQGLLGPWALLAPSPAVHQACWGALSGGESSAQTLLQEYLGVTVQPSQGMRAAVEEEEVCPFASLPSIFGPALALGLVSYRQLHALAVQGQQREEGRESGGGVVNFSESDKRLMISDVAEMPLMQRLFPDPWKRTRAAAVRHARAAEWHDLLAAFSQQSSQQHRALQGTSSAAGGDLESLVHLEPGSESRGSGGNGSASASDVEEGAREHRRVGSSSAGEGSGEKADGGLGSEDCGVPVPAGVSVGHWRWRGMLIEYASAGITAKPGLEGKPAFLLVHGFGAFWQHYRDVMLPLAEQGHRVFALTLPGFGRSAKPAAAYSQYLWSQCVQDFIADVIQEPVIVAGNSIGGYTVACAAADCPQLVQSVVLFNSAGRIDPSVTLTEGSSPDAFRHSREYAAGVVREKRSGGPPRIVVWGFARALLAYLQSSTGSVIKRCYPNRPERADAPLVSEILRAGLDPGSIGIIESVFFLPKPRPLNLLLEVFGGPVLVLQGRNDPLNDAVARANAIKVACPGAAVELLEAGHCPHDEVPEVVVGHLVEWATAPWCDSSRSSAGTISASALGEEGPLEILEEEALLGAGLKGGPGGKRS